MQKSDAGDVKESAQLSLERGRTTTSYITLRWRFGHTNSYY